MNKVYIVTHEIYSYEDHDYDTTVEVFDSLESAMNYYLMKKEMIDNDYLEYLDVDVLDMNNDEYLYVHELSRGTFPLYHIEYDEYGFDKLSVESKQIMNFN